jgi:hypothetical protein
MGVFLFDLHKWIAFLVTTDTTDGQIDAQRGTMVSTQRIERRIKLIDKILIVSQILLSCAFLTFLIGYLANYGSSTGETTWILARSKFVLSFYLVFLIIYSTSFYILTQRLRRYFPDFYKSEKGRVLSLCACILVSIIGRIVMSAILSYREIIVKILDSLQENTWPGPVAQFLSVTIGSLIPFAAMTYSLLHAIKEKQGASQSLLRDSTNDSKAYESQRSDSKRLNSLKSYD